MAPVIKQFLRDALEETTTGNRAYHIWMAVLTALMCLGAYSYSIQLREGLSVTGMHDHVSWGLYISNFTFLVGVAAAAVVLVLPAYILHDVDFGRAVLMGEAVAVSAVIMAISFVVVDVGGPARLWHVIPVIGLLNWPNSLLAWDIIVLNGYLVLNVCIPLYILLAHYRGLQPDKRRYAPFVMLSIFWAVSLHLVTAFLYAGLASRPYWNNALMGPRFLATAFAAGPALMILILEVIRRKTDFDVGDATIHKLSLVVTVAAQISVIMLLSEVFKEFYFPTHHSLSAQYLYFGLDGKASLKPFIWVSVGMVLISTFILTLNPLRARVGWRNTACALLFLGILLEKGLGTIIPGFIPEPWGRIDEYIPTWIELTVSLGIWALGAFVFTVLAKAAIPIELGRKRFTST